MSAGDVRVRVETPMLGLAWRQEAVLERSPLVEAAIAEGRLTVLDSDGEDKPLTGGLLDDALRRAGMPLEGTADEKRARLHEHTAEEARRAAEPGPPDAPGVPATASTAAPAGATAGPATPPVTIPAPRGRAGRP